MFIWKIERVYENVMMEEFEMKRRLGIYKGKGRGRGRGSVGNKKMK